MIYLKKITELLKKYILQKWWVPLLLFLLSSFIFLILTFSKNQLLLDLSDFFFIFSSVILLIAGTWQLIKGKRHIGLLQLIILLIGFVLVIFASAFILILTSHKDSSKNDLKLQEDVELKHSINLKSSERENFEKFQPDSGQEEISFQFHNSSQANSQEYNS